MAYVYVLNKKGQPLMPTTRCGKVRKLLKQGKAVVVNNNPFTIRLKYDTPNITQPLYCGVDVGRENIGIGVSNEKGECIFLVEVSTNNKQVTKNMSERATFRRERRRYRRIRKQRKAIKTNTTFESGNEDILRSKKKCLSKEISYPGMNESITHKVMKGKEAKFNNRKRKDDWLTPSARNLIQIHINVVKKIQKFLPVTNINVENNIFDFQKLENIDIKHWEYQQGTLYGFKNYKDYINKQQNGICLLCENKNHKIKHYHHIVPKHRNGSNNPKNIAGLCEYCHTLVHTNEEYETILLEKKQGIYKQHEIGLLNSCMSNIIDEYNKFLPTTCSFGFETKTLREQLHLPKGHSIDGYIISLLNRNVLFNYNELEIIFKQNFIINPINNYHIKHFKKKSGGNILKRNTRQYFFNGKLVATNRHKAIAQTNDSLEEYMNTYASNHNKKECNQHFHQLTIVPAKRIYTYHKQGIVSPFKCGDKVKYTKKNKIKGNTKSFVFIIESVKIQKQYLCYNNTKECKMKFCSILESNSLVFI